MVGMTDTHITPGYKGGLWHNSLALLPLMNLLSSRISCFIAMPDFEIICLKGKKAKLSKIIVKVTVFKKKKNFYTSSLLSFFFYFILFYSLPKNGIYIRLHLW